MNLLVYNHHLQQVNEETDLIIILTSSSYKINDSDVYDLVARCLLSLAFVVEFCDFVAFIMIRSDDGGNLFLFTFPQKQLGGKETSFA